ncbi:RnfABCDGE type electron transport complex subunit D [Planococcus lenghuensis]|uniref:RnfABCDGE type electron transport complex subunit D n=1 Tax=Planococcus lenghuensis TaxID=2213202 RepID=A0A1Q2KYR7_9BACL|nr:RnfABCDGE type electron transport complex subunit D [Planococcus lenghuensis]AQQ53244.1 hypothetical protein B0X71_09245 [Planococcus lenghuensis]
MAVIRDPRTMQIILLSTYAVLGLSLLQFSVTVVQIAVTLVLCVVLEILFVYAKQGKFIWPASALITGLGISLALRAEALFPFMVAAVAAIALKHLVRYKGKHIFNPSNSGIVAVALLVPIAATDPLQWGNYLWVLALMSIGGFWLVYRVHKLPLVITFLGAFVGIHALRLFLWPEIWNTHFSSFMWGGLFIFTFNMITDPATSPKSMKSQVVFGALIALLAQVLIHLNVHHAVFISLAVVCAGWFLMRWLSTQFQQNKSSSFAK